MRLDKPISPTLALAALTLAATSCHPAARESGTGAGTTCRLAPAATLDARRVDPPDGALGVGVDTAVSVRFNTCLDLASLAPTSLLFSGPKGSVRAWVRYEAETATLVLHPNAPLAFAAHYSVGIGAARGAHGEVLATPIFSSFTTRPAPEAAPPEIELSALGPATAPSLVEGGTGAARR